MNDPVKTTEVELTESEYTREINLIEQPHELQLQMNAHGDENFIDLNHFEVENLRDELSRYLKERAI